MPFQFCPSSQPRQIRITSRSGINNKQGDRSTSHRDQPCRCSSLCTMNPYQTYPPTKNVGNSPASSGEPHGYRHPSTPSYSAREPRHLLPVLLLRCLLRPRRRPRGWHRRRRVRLAPDLTSACPPSYLEHRDAGMWRWWTERYQIRHGNAYDEMFV